MLKGQVTVGTIVYMVIMLMIFAAMLPLVNSAINSAWDYLNPMGQALAALIVPAVLLGVILIPFGYHSILGYFRRGGGEEY